MLLGVLNMIIILVLLFAFFFFSKEKSWQFSEKSIFECGYTSYFSSRFSFPIHYFTVALTFLFLDLELVFLFPFFLEDSQNFSGLTFLFFFALNLTLGLLMEWNIGLLDWKN